ncbi:MAG: beta-lactamase [Caulobacteraceae bacterium]|nr:beta-lactamase [Caulobacteraceae bacterium]
MLHPTNRDILAICHGRPGPTPAAFDLSFEADTRSEALYSWPPGSGDWEDRVFKIGCLQDFIAGATVFSMVQDGLIDPNIPIGAYLPELRDEGEGPGDTIRVVDTLTHSAGYCRPAHPVGGWSEVVDYLLTAYPNFPAGKVVSYGNLEHILLAELVRRVAGRSFNEEMRDRIFRPAGADLTLFEGASEDFEHMPLAAKVKDLVRVLAFIRSESGPFGQAFFSALKRDRLSAVASPHAESTQLPIGYSWGFSCFKDGLWGQSGRADALSVGIRVHESEHFVLAMAVGSSPFHRDHILHGLCRAFGYSPPGIGASVPIGAITSLDPDQVPGRYDAGDSWVEVISQDGNLQCTMFRQRTVIGTLKGILRKDGVILGDSRWPGARMEFFPHPTTGKSCVRLGVVSFVGR